MNQEYYVIMRSDLKSCLHENGKLLCSRNRESVERYAKAHNGICKYLFTMLFALSCSLIVLV